MIARSAPHRRNRRNLQPNPGLLALTIAIISVTAEDPGGAQITLDPAMAPYSITNRPEDYSGFTISGASPDMVTVVTPLIVLLHYAVVPSAGDVMKIGDGELAIRTRLGGQIPAQSITLA